MPDATGEQIAANLQDPSSDTFSAQSMADSVALALVNATYDSYRNWRYLNHDRRWTTHDQLFYGYMPKRTWEGTQVPRSSLPVHLVFTQVESALPVITNALFNDVEWFEVDALAGTTLDQARQQKERLLYLLENPRNRVGNTARNEIRLAAKQLLLYGNGGVVIEHDGETGDPTVNWVDIRDLYIDPGCTTPMVDDARSLVHRDFVTLDDLEGLRGAPGVRVPPREILRTLAEMRPWDTGDTTKQLAEAQRGVQFRPGSDDWTQFRPHKQLEVLRYWDEDRTVWVLQRKWVLYNERTTWGFMPYCFAPCYTVPGRFYAMSIADALEGNQKYSQAILNAHLDEVSLGLNPPRIQNRSANITQGQMSLRPGAVFGVNDPQKDIVLQWPSGATKDGWQELQYLSADSEKLTGVTSMISQGMPLRSNASRTATGIQAQTAGPTTRLQHLVEMLEDYLVVPMLYKLVAMDSARPDGSQVRGMTPSGGFTDVPTSSLKAPVRFRIKASSRMLTQSKLQSMTPFLAQYLLNGAFVNQLAKQGQAIDYTEFFRLIQDATGTRSAYNLIRPMTPQEQQAIQQPSPDAQLKSQAADKSQQVRLRIEQMRDQAGKDEAAMKAAQGNEEMALELLKMLQTVESGQAAATMGPPVGPQPGGTPPGMSPQQMLQGGM